MVDPEELPLYTPLGDGTLLRVPFPEMISKKAHLIARIITDGGVDHPALIQAAMDYATEDFKNKIAIALAKEF